MRRDCLYLAILSALILFVVGVAVALWMTGKDCPNDALACSGSIASIFGFVAIVIGVLVWWCSRPLREPDLVIKAKRYKCNYQFLQIQVSNKPVKGWWGKFALAVIGRDERPTAEQCTFTVDVDKPDDEEPFPTMHGRWNESPEPFVPPSVPVLRQPLGRIQFDRTIWGVPSLAHAVVRTPLDILPGGDKEWAGIFIKHDGDPNSYGFNTGSYFWPGFKYEKYKIGQGCFEVTVCVRSGSYKKSECFILTNKGTTLDPCDFNLKLKCPKM